jgi:prepilin-type processing-associated H-X9-DG protein
MECPACGQPVDESASECPSCGTDTRLTVRAPDGASYGPYPLASIRQYAAEGRIPPGSALQADDGRALTLAEVGVAPALPVMSRRAPATSGGQGWLIGVIVLVVGVALLSIIAILAAILLPVFAKAREKARQAACQSNVKQLSLACQQYAYDNDSTLPDAATWQQDIRPYLPSSFTWDCPSSHRGKQSYEFNPELSGRSLAEIADPATTPMVYESEGYQTGSGPHSGGWNTGFADGHVKWMRQSPRSQLQGPSGGSGIGP